MSDGGSYSSLRKRYASALSAGESSLRALLGSPSSTWKSIQSSSDTRADPNGLSSALERSSSAPSPSCVSSRIEGPVILHRRKAKNAPDVIRAICHVPVTDHAAALESFRAILQTPEIRSDWDKVTEKQEVLEIVEPAVRVQRSYTRLGWPSNPRDIVTVNKVLQDPGKTLIDLSVSLPRSASSKINDEPPFLQPSPPYVRSHLHLCAFVLTFPKPGIARISLYWQWDLRAAGLIWGSHINTIPDILRKLVELASQRSSLIPYLRGWGRELTLESETYDASQDKLTLTYGLHHEQGDDSDRGQTQHLEKSKERRRLERAVELRLPPLEDSGWDIAVTAPLPAQEVQWTCVAEKTISETSPRSRISLRCAHSRSSQDYVAVSITLQRMAGSHVLRLNGAPLQVFELEERDPASTVNRTTATPPTSLKLEVASIATRVSADSASATSNIQTVTPSAPPSPTTQTRRTDARLSQDALIRHNQRIYTDFLALLQSPPAKWRSTTEVRRVAVSSYVSIDTAAIPVYKYEATFVNTSIWDVLSVFVDSQARLVWDKASGLEEIRFLKAVRTDEADGKMAAEASAAVGSGAGEGSTTFWHAKWRASWPTASRDALLLRTIYKSPTSIHVFLTSVPEHDPTLSKLVSDALPKSEDHASPVRVHTHIQAIAIDQISPTTTSLTMVDQTDLKGWAKTGYSAMAAAVANIGDFTLRSGAPPVITQLSNATQLPPAEASSGGSTYAFAYLGAGGRTESVLRCDSTVWSVGGISIKVKPAPARVSILSRHRLSDRGPGCWITIEHDEQSSLGEADNLPHPVEITVKKGDPKGVLVKDKNSIWVNGERQKVEIEEMNEEEVKERKAQKRIRGMAHLLDQPSTTPRGHRSRPSSVLLTEDLAALAVQPAKPLSRPPSVLSYESKEPQQPMEYALAALTWLQSFYTEQIQQESVAGTADEWAILSYTENNSPIRISRRTIPQLSSTLPLYRVDRTFPKTSPEQVMRLVSSLDTATRSSWDDRIASLEPISYYEHGCSTSVSVTKPVFPLRSRITYTANIKAQMVVPAPPGSSASSSTTYLYASASIPVSAFGLEAAASSSERMVAVDKLNPTRIAEGSMALEGWIIESGSAGSGDADDSADQEAYSRCSFFTCSDLPGVGSGPFSLASIRSRLSFLFDSLERTLRKPIVGPSLRMPIAALQIEGSLQGHGPQEECWKIGRASGHSHAIYNSSSSAVLLISAPLPASGEKGKGKLSATEEGKTDGLLSKRSSRLFDEKPSANPNEREDTKSASSRPARPAPKPAPSTSSLTRLQTLSAPSSEDTVIAELIIKRDESIAGFDIKSTATLLGKDDRVLPSDASCWKALTPLPLKVVVIPLSTPIASAREHLLRISLPTTQFTTPLQHPLSGLTTAPMWPRWYRRLTEGKAVLRLHVTPVKVHMQVEGRPLSALRVSLDGVQVNVAGEADVKQWQQRLEEDEGIPEASKLSRIASKQSSTGLPPSLAKPRIVNSAFLAGSAVSATIAPGAAGITSPAEPSPKVDSAQRRMASEASLSSAVGNIEKATQPLVEMFTATTLVAQGSAVAGGKPKLERTYRLSFVLLVAVMSFLVGSLLRSLLSPGDYVFFTQSVNNVEAAALELLDPKRRWKFATRLLEVPIPGLGRDLIAAVVERRLR